MSAYFHISMPDEGVYHIGEPLGVCATLLTGTRGALLYDTGYGLSDIAACVRQLTELPVTVALSHGHHDHALGACQFSEVYLHPDDQELFVACTSRESRLSILQQARDKQSLIEPFDMEHYMARKYAQPAPLRETVYDLGGMTARVIPLPGHTRGSVALYVKERELLLLGDNWNPHTWLFLPGSATVADYKAAMRGVLALPFTRALVSHDPAPRPRAQLEAYVEGITAACLAGAERDELSESWQGIEVFACYPEPGSRLVFDRQRQGAIA